MMHNSQEIIEMLKQQRSFHEEQLRLIDIALSAIETGSPPATGSIAQKKKEENNLNKHRIPWTKEIDRLLYEYDQFNIIDLQNDLAEKRGIATAMTIQGRNVISNTLSRFIKRGRIEKIRPGVYQVVTESLSS